MKKVLVTGISGFIGNYLYKHKPDNIQLSGTYFKNKPELLEAKLLKLDLMQVDKFVAHNTQNFDVVIHCASESSLTECEKNQEKAYLLNSEATERLASWSFKQKSKFLFLSTDIVFEGNKGDYSETDKPQPINIYGKSKLDAEKKILKIHENAVIVRLALCLGRGLGNTISFIDWFLSRLENDESVPLFYNEFRTPVSAKFAAQAIWELASNEFNGIIHLTGKDKINRYDIGVKMLDYLNSNKHHLLKKESSGNAAYPRPKDVSMKSINLSKILKVKQENSTTFIENIL